MRFTPLALPGVYLVELEPHADERGFFARAWCRREFAAHGLEVELAQCNFSLNHVAGTLRGLHYQAAPHAEAKLVRCLRGALFDVAVDLRPESPTYGCWCSAELTEANYRALYLPAGLAHGFQTLAAETLVFYQMSAFYAPEAARGLRWDDPTLAIPWPLPDPCLSDRDRAFPSFAP